MLTTVSKVKAHLGIPEASTSKNAVLETIINGVSSFIETQTHRKFGEAEYTEAIDADGSAELFLSQFPVSDIAKITDLKSGTEIDTEAEIANRTLIYDLDAGILHRSVGWPAGRKNIEVEYTAGYVLPGDEESDSPATLPDAIEQACIRMSARIYERKTAEGVQSVSPSSFTATYNLEIDPELKAVIKAYRKPRR